MTTTKGNPSSIGLIMDGNRRWAKKHKLPFFEGHNAGYKKLKEFLKWSRARGIKTLYVYAFSTENWNRSKNEVSYLMDFFKRLVTEEAQNLIKEKVRVRFVGQIDRFSLPIRAGIKALEKSTAHFGSDLVICVSYGGRAEIIQTIKSLIADKGISGIKNLTEEIFSRYLWTKNLAEPELIIRTSGEVRTSNFLMWQSAYSEWFFSKTLWPAFTEKEFDRILKDFRTRETRRGR